MSTFEKIDVGTARRVGVLCFGQTIGEAISSDEDPTVPGSAAYNNAINSEESIPYGEPSSDFTNPNVQSQAAQILSANAAGYSDAQVANALANNLQFVSADPNNPQAGGTWQDQSGSEVDVGAPAGPQSGQGGTTYIQNGYGQNIASTGGANEDISQGVPDSADDIFGSNPNLFPAGTSGTPQLLKFPDGSLYYNVGGQLYSYSWVAQSYLQYTGQQASPVADNPVATQTSTAESPQVVEAGFDAIGNAGNASAILQIIGRGITIGDNLKLYPSGWGGGGRGLIQTADIGEYFGKLGGVFTLGSALIDTDQVLEGKITPQHYVTNLVFDGIGFIGPVGAGVSIAYSVYNQANPNGVDNIENGVADYIKKTL